MLATRDRWDRRGKGQPWLCESPQLQLLAGLWSWSVGAVVTGPTGLGVGRDPLGLEKGYLGRWGL